MRLLVVTQAVDTEDTVLGFFHRWLEELAQRYESIEVICLKEGKHALPGNVAVHSLGKERFTTLHTSSSLLKRLLYVTRFYRLMFGLRSDYDAIFVHMNSEYVVLGGLIWKAMGKRVVLWRNHKKASFAAYVASNLADAVCYTSPSSYTARFKHSLRMPIGIDTGRFAPASSPAAPGTILFLGRLDPVKKPELFVEALTRLDADGADFRADIYGDPTAPDAPYVAPLHRSAEPLVKKGKLAFHSGVPNTETPALYGSHAIYVNLTPSGSFDKTIGEAMACGAVVVCSNDAVRGVVPEHLMANASAEEATAGIGTALKLAPEERAKLAAANRAYVEKEHSLSLLTDKLFGILAS